MRWWQSRGRWRKNRQSQVLTSGGRAIRGASHGPGHPWRHLRQRATCLPRGPAPERQGGPGRAGNGHREPSPGPAGSKDSLLGLPICRTGPRAAPGRVGRQQPGWPPRRRPWAAGRPGSKARGLAGGLPWQPPHPSKSRGRWGQLQNPSEDPRPKRAEAHGRAGAGVSGCGQRASGGQAHPMPEATGVLATLQRGTGGHREEQERGAAGSHQGVRWAAGQLGSQQPRGPPPSPS